MVPEERSLAELKGELQSCRAELIVAQGRYEFLHAEELKLRVQRLTHQIREMNQRNEAH